LYASLLPNVQSIKSSKYGQLVGAKIRKVIIVQVCWISLAVRLVS